MNSARWLKDSLARSWRGTLSAGAGFALPLGGWWLGNASCLDETGRLSRGIAIILPGIEGRGALSWSICRGVLDGGFSGAVILWDWTTGLWPLLLFHLRARRRNQNMALMLAQRILDYQSAYPGRPVHLIGHSGGAAMAAWAIAALPEGRAVTGAVMLGSALSSRFHLGPALRKVDGFLWNFWSPLEAPLLGAGTLLVGTADGRHAVSAGLCGFFLPTGSSPQGGEVVPPPASPALLQTPDGEAVPPRRTFWLGQPGVRGRSRRAAAVGHTIAGPARPDKISYPCARAATVGGPIHGGSIGEHKP